MRNIKLLFPIFFTFASIMTIGCGDNVEDTLKGNEDVIPDVSDSVPVLKDLDKVAGLFQTAQACVIETDKHKYQAQFNLHIDNYSGYMALPHSFYGKFPSTYSLYDYLYGVTERFLNFCVQVTPVMKSGSAVGVPELGAMGEIMFALGSHIMVDSYGAFPYQHYKKMNQGHPIYYYSGEDIYDSIFVSLKNSVEVLKAYKQKPEIEQKKLQDILETQDCVSGKSVDNWIKFANSLRLRLALRMTKADPVRAQKEAEDAVAAGVLTEADKDFGFDVNRTPETCHPLYKIARTWVDTRLNASFLNMLQRLQCPLLEEWFDKNAGHADGPGDFTATDGSGNHYDTNFAFMGIRNGISLLDQGNASNNYIKYSTVNSKFAFKNIAWMKVSEVLFLQAEGALRGWNMGGTPESFYNRAMQIGMKRELVSPRRPQEAIDKYLAVEKADESINYIDYTDQEYNCKGVITLGVKWNNGDNFETKLERIMIQKYILNFPQSVEAWSDIRRTGYPKLLPLVFDNGDGSILPGDIVRRMPFTIADPRGQEDAETYGVKALGGADLQGTHVWWDKE